MIVVAVVAVMALAAAVIVLVSGWNHDLIEGIRITQNV
jgi:hypothetical protein